MLALVTMHISFCLGRDALIALGGNKEKIINEIYIYMREYKVLGVFHGGVCVRLVSHLPFCKAHKTDRTLQLSIGTFPQPKKCHFYNSVCLPAMRG